MASSRRTKKLTQRAARRRAERELVNATARSAAREAEREPPAPKQVRHVSQLQLLESRGSITADMHEVGMRFAQDFAWSDPDQLSPLIARYAPAFRTKKRRATWSSDEPHVLDARARFEAACGALGALSGIMIHGAVCDLPAGEWCRKNGSLNGDGPPLLRAALLALEAHYRRPIADQLAEAAARAPRHVDVPTPQPVAKRASPARVEERKPGPGEVPAGSYSDLLDCWAAYPFVTDQLLRKALGFADARGWFNGAGSPEDRIIAARLRDLAGERWAEPGEDGASTRGAYERRDVGGGASRNPAPCE